MINPITNRKILFFGEDIPEEELRKINGKIMDCGEYDLPPQLNKGTFLSDCEGAIKKVLFAVNSDEFDDVKNIIKVFIRKKRPGIKVVIFVAQDKFDSLKSLDDTNEDVTCFPSEVIGSRWIQDQIMVVEYEEEKKKEQLFLVTKGEDFPFVEELSKKLIDKEIEEADAILVGGNMIRFGNDLLVGIDSVESDEDGRNFRKFKCRLSSFETKADINFVGNKNCFKEESFFVKIISLLKRGFPKISLITGCQPQNFLYHIDLLILPLDSRRVIIGLPKIAEPEKLNAEYWRDSIDKQREYMKALANRIDKEIIPVDIPFLKEGRKEIYGYYTNSIIDNYNKQITAYIPTYALKTPSFEKMENQFIKKLLEEKVNVVKMADFSALAKKRGALRCMMKVIERN